MCIANYVKGRKSGDKFSEYKKNPKKEESTVFYCSHFQRKKCSHTSSHDGKIKGVERFLQHICVTIKRYFTQCSDNCPHQHN